MTLQSFIFNILFYH